MKKTIYQKSLFFNNNWQKSKSRKKLERSYYDKKLFFKSSNNIDFSNLILSAEKASDTWSKYTLKDRKKIVRLISSILKKNKNLIAKEMMIDTGKSYIDCYQELTFCHKLWDEASKVNKKFFQKIKKVQNKITIKEIKQPIGIVGLFIPFNNYMVVLSERLPFLLMSGSIAVIKPNELGVLGIIKFLDLIKKKVKKLPGIISLIVGDKRIGSKIVKSKKTSMIDFTGSNFVGKEIAIEGAKLFKRINLELGGKNPTIITNTADLKKATISIIKDFTGNAGQNCVAISRAYIDKRIYKKFKDLLIYYLKKEKFNQKLRNKKNTMNILDFLNTNKKYFKKKVCFGKISNDSENFQPLVFENINKKNFIYKKELFMPILILEKFNKIEEAIDKSNDSEYGLSGTLWAKKSINYEKILSKIESGRLWLNGSIYQNFPFLRVGGLKSSGNGRVAGIDSIDNYSIFKTLIINKS
jgi:acyl-CoA reductase-like NAD-dependent aldehyde dehydrogenase